MMRHFKYSTVIAGLMGLSTLVMFHQGAEALDLSDFSGADQKVITQDAPKAGGIVLVKENIVYPSQPSQIQATVAQPVNAARPAPVTTNAGSYNAITPAAGGAPVRAGISSQNDITLRPGNAFDQAQAKFQGAAASTPVDGKPLTTTTLADGARVSEMNDITPAAGVVTPAAVTSAPPVRRAKVTSASIDNGPSLQAMTGRGQSTGYNN